jgi:hypothetical protein
VKAQLDARALKHVAKVFLARRVIPADPAAVQHVMAVQLSWWGRRRGQQRAVVDRLAAIEWPAAVIVLTLDGRFAPMKRRLGKLADARVV